MRNKSHSESNQTETCLEDAQLNDCGFEYAAYYMPDKMNSRLISCRNECHMIFLYVIISEGLKVGPKPFNNL